MRALGKKFATLLRNKRTVDMVPFNLETVEIVALIFYNKNIYRHNKTPVKIAPTLKPIALQPVAFWNRSHAEG